MAFEKTIPLNEFITLQRGFDLPQDKRIKGDIPVIASTGIVGYHNEEKVQAPGVVITEVVVLVVVNILQTISGL